VKLSLTPRFCEPPTPQRVKFPVTVPASLSLSTTKGVEPIRFAVPAALLAVRSINLDHRHRCSREMAGGSAF